PSSLKTSRSASVSLRNSRPPSSRHLKSLLKGWGRGFRASPVMKIEPSRRSVSIAECSEPVSAARARGFRAQLMDDPVREGEVHLDLRYRLARRPAQAEIPTVFCIARLQAQRALTSQDLLPHENHVEIGCSSIFQLPHDRVVLRVERRWKSHGELSLLQRRLEHV